MVVIFLCTILNNECRFQEPYCSAGCPLVQCMLRSLVLKVGAPQEMHIKLEVAFVKYGLKLLVLQNMLACCYLSKALRDPQKTSIQADLQHGYTVKQNHESPGTLSPWKCSLPSPLLLLPPVLDSFPLLLGQTLTTSGNYPGCSFQ